MASDYQYRNFVTTQDLLTFMENHCSGCTIFNVIRLEPSKPTDSNDVSCTRHHCTVRYFTDPLQEELNIICLFINSSSFRHVRSNIRSINSNIVDFTRTNGPRQAISDFIHPLPARQV